MSCTPHGAVSYNPWQRSAMAIEDFEPSPLTWIGSNRRLARRVGRPMQRFLRIEAAGGVVLLLATLLALLWVNSPWSHSYHDFFETHVRIHLGGLLTLDEPLQAWINDALMTIFFFVVGMEIKLALIAGELRQPRVAALPVIAALGGMVFPALIYFAFNPSGVAASGWGIPMATDIAFALGIVSLLGSRVPASVKIFLLTLAIVDDIGAIAVIAVFYTDDLSTGWLLLAVAAVAVTLAMRVARVWYTPAYLVVGLFLWLAVFESGVHATIAGVILGLITPANPLKLEPGVADELVDRITGGDVNPLTARRANFEIREQLAVADRLQNLLHPWSSFLIVPLFALANAGIEVSSETIGAAMTSPVTLGVVGGLIVGKLVGVTLFTWLGVRSGIAVMPRDANWHHVFGLAAVAGIGFTVSLFITSLAFTDMTATAEAKFGILAASAVAAVAGVIIFLRSSRPTGIMFDEAMNSQQAEQVQAEQATG